MRSPLRAELPAHPRTPSTVRALVTEWLHQGDCRVETTQDLVLAVNEAVTNSVEHAYPPGGEGTITVEAIAQDSAPGGIDPGGGHRD